MEQPRGDAAAARRPLADAARRRRDPALGIAGLHFRRTATADTELHGVRIREGDKVVVWLSPATTTSSQFPDPLTFDIDPHAEPRTSPSAAADRTSAWARTWPRWRSRIMFEELLPRLSAVELTGPALRMHSNFTNAYKSMPVRVTTA